MFWWPQAAISAKGFDDARLDTLFLTMPVSWRGILAQYAGRLHRLHAAKRDVVIYDYVDGNEPMLAKMAARREAGIGPLGIGLSNEPNLPDRECLQLSCRFQRDRRAHRRCLSDVLSLIAARSAHRPMNDVVELAPAASIRRAAAA